MKKVSFILVFLFTVFILFGCSSDTASYNVFEEDDRGDSYNIKVDTSQTSKEELETIVDDIEKEYSGKDAVWLWIYDEKNDDLLAKAKIPYNDKGEIMIGEEKTVIEFE